MEVKDSLNSKLPFIRDMIVKVKGTIYEAMWKKIHRLISSGK
jgi:hypothetical protein